MRNYSGLLLDGYEAFQRDLATFNKTVVLMQSILRESEVERRLREDDDQTLFQVWLAGSPDDPLDGLALCFMCCFRTRTYSSSMLRDKAVTKRNLETHLWVHIEEAQREFRVSKDYRDSKLHWVATHGPGIWKLSDGSMQNVYLTPRHLREAVSNLDNLVQVVYENVPEARSTLDLLLNYSTQER